MLNREIGNRLSSSADAFPAKLPIRMFLKAEVTYFPHRFGGGDYYDLIHENLKIKFYFVLLMCAGKGSFLAALLNVLIFQSYASNLASECITDLETIRVISQFLPVENTKSAKRFITFFLAIWIGN